MGFHSGLIKERLVEFYKRYFITQGKRAIPLPLRIKNLSFCKWIVKIKQWYSINICEDVKYKSKKFNQLYQRKNKLLV